MLGSPLRVCSFELSLKLSRFDPYRFSKQFKPSEQFLLHYLWYSSSTNSEHVQFPKQCLFLDHGDERGLQRVDNDAPSPHRSPNLDGRQQAGQ